MMNRRQKLVQQQFLNNEEAVIKRLNKVYTQSLQDVEAKIKNLTFSIGELQQKYDWMDPNDPERAKVKSQIQSKIYQKKYQEQLQAQLAPILNQMQTSQFTTVSGYLDECYSDGFVGTVFDAHGQGVPITTPIDQESMVRAVQLESKISQGLYTRLGEDVDLLKKKITAQVSRGIATGMSYAQVAKQLTNYTRIGYNRSIRIARTEGHRIQNTAAMDAMTAAKDRGADIVKQWDATLDGATRESHVAVDMEIRELDKPFSNGLMFPGDPSGSAAEVINCRCSLDQRARWALDDGEFTKFNNFTKQVQTFKSPEDYDEFKKAFFSRENRQYMNYVQQMEEKYGTKDFAKVLEKMSDREFDHYSKLVANNPIYNRKSQPTTKPKVVGGVPAGINECKTVADVEALMKSRRWFNVQTLNGTVYDSNEAIDLSGLDLECVREIFRAHEQVFEKYPQLIGKLNAINSAKLSSDTYAQCMMGLGHGGITVNVTKFADVAKLVKSYERDVQYGFHPIGTDWTAIVTHELGHAIDDYLTNTLHIAGFQNRGWLPKYVSADLRPKVMKTCGLKVSDAMKEVSEYATKDSKEWFAECFAEYMKSEDPRKVATEFGKRLDDIMKGVK